MYTAGSSKSRCAQSLSAWRLDTLNEKLHAVLREAEALLHLQTFQGVMVMSNVLAFGVKGSVF